MIRIKVPLPKHVKRSNICSRVVPPLGLVNTLLQWFLSCFFFLDQNFALFSVNNSTGGEHLFLNLIHLCSHRNPRLLLMPKSVLFDVKSSGRKNLRLRSRKNPWGVSLQQFNPPGSHQSQIYGHFLSSYTIFHFGANILEICVYFVPRVSSKAVWV